MKTLSSKIKSKSVISQLVSALLFIAVIALLIGLPIVVVWNLIVPAIFGLPTINFFQAAGLYFLFSVFGLKGSSLKD